MFHRPTQRDGRAPARRQRTIRRRGHLQSVHRPGIEHLEDRLAPASQLFSGLEFLTATPNGTFSVTNNVMSTTSPVEVGVDPQGGTFTPLLVLQKGVTFTQGDATGTFTTAGDVQGEAGGSTVDLINAGASPLSFQAPALLGQGSYDSPATGGTNSVVLPVDGANLFVSGLHFGAQELDVQGSLSLPILSGITLPVAGATDYVALTSGGVQFAGLDVDLPQTAGLGIGGVKVSVGGVHVHYASGDFDLSGTASASVLGSSLTLTLGGAQSPGLVVSGGSLVSLDATIDSSVNVAGLSLDLTGLAIVATAGSDLTIGGKASASFSVAGSKESVTLDLGTAGLDIDLSSGQLKALNATLDGSISIAGLTISEDALNVNFSGSILTISGKAGASFEVGGMQEAGMMLDFGTGGLVIDTSGSGQLKALNAHLSGSLNLAGLDVSVDNLGVSFSGSILTVSGKAGASFDVAGNDESASIDFGTGGLVIDTSGVGKLVSLDATLSGSLSIADASVSLDDLSFAYGASTGDFTISGGTSLDFKQANLSVELGGSYSQGIVIQGDSLVSFQATITGGFDLLGVKFQADKLSVAYVAANGTTPTELAVTGSVSIQSPFLNVTTTLADQGLVIANGALQNLDVEVDGGFSMFGLSVTAKNLAIEYDASSQQLALSGGFDVDFAGNFVVAAAITKGELLINTSNGDLSVSPGGMTVEGELAFGQYEVDVSVSFDPAHPTDFAVSGTVAIQNTFSVSLTKLDVVGGQLVDIGLAETRSIAIGTSGWFFDGLSGELDNLNNPSKIVVKAAAEVSYGKPVQLPSFEPIYAGGTAALVDATGEITVSAGELKLAGNVSLLGGLLGQGSASIDLNWATGVYTVSGNFGMYDNTFNFGGSLTITTAGDLTVLANASVNVPPQVPFVGGDSLASVNFFLHYNPSLPLSQDVVAAWTTVIGFTIGFDFDFQGDFKVLDGSGVAGLTAEATAQSQAPYYYSYPFTIPATTAAGAAPVGSEITLNSPALTSGSVVTSASNEGHVGFYTAPAPGSNAPVTTTYQLANQLVNPGSLNVKVYDESFFGTYNYVGLVTFNAGQFVLNTAGGTSPIVPTGGRLNSDGSLVLNWPASASNLVGGHYSIIQAGYTADTAYLTLLQQVNGTYQPVQVYTIDPVASAGGSNSYQSTTAAELTMSQPQVYASGTDDHQGGSIRTLYQLPGGTIDVKTVTFTAHDQSGAKLGTGYFDPGGQLHYTAAPGASIASPSAGGVGTNLDGTGYFYLVWPSNATNTWISISYASLSNRVFDISLNQSIPGGTPGAYEVQLVSGQSMIPSNELPAFSATTLYQAPVVQFFYGTPTLNPSDGSLSVSFGANAFTPDALNPATSTATVAFYYTTSSTATGGTQFATYNFSQLQRYQGGPSVGSFSWPGFASLPAGTYYIYAVINDGTNAPQVSPQLGGPFTEGNPDLTLAAPTNLALSNGGSGFQGTFGAGTANALGLSANFPNPIQVNLSVSSGTLVLPNGVQGSSLHLTFTSAADATSNLANLRYIAGAGFAGSDTLTISAVPVIRNVPMPAQGTSATVALVSPNAHLVVNQSVDASIPGDPSQHVIAVTIANPGGFQGQAATGVQVLDQLPPGVTVLSASATQGTFDVASGRWTVGTLPIGSAPQTLTLTVQDQPQTQGLVLNNVARASGDLPEVPASDATSTATIRRASPIALTVTNANDSGPGSLRWALQVAETGDTIGFAPGLSGQTIALTSGELLVNQGVTIVGPTGANGSPALFISGNNAGRVFDIQGNPSGVNVAISNLVIENGLAVAKSPDVGAVGGGLLIDDAGGTVDLANLLIMGNGTASGQGLAPAGGGAAVLAGTVTFRDDTIASNLVAAQGSGGGLDVVNGNVTLIGDTVASNQAGLGGGVAVSGGVLNLTSDTLAGNSAGSGGDLGQSGTAFVEATDTIFATGSAAPTGAPDVSGSVAVSDHNLVDNASGSSGFSASFGDQINVPANLAPLGNHVGPLPTMPPLPGSPAINGADPGDQAPEQIPGLIGWWTGGGTAADATGASVSSAVGGVTYGNAGGRTLFKLDGLTGYVQTTTTAAALSSSDALSVSALVDPSAYTADDAIVDRTDGTNDEYRFGIDSTGHLYFANGPKGSGLTEVMTTAATVPLSAVSQVGFTYSSTTHQILFYINGAQFLPTALQNVTGFGFVNPGPLDIGHDSSGGFFQGLLGDVAVYHATLTPAQMATLAGTSQAVQSGAAAMPGLVGLITGSGGLAHDSTGNLQVTAGTSVGSAPGVVGQAFELGGPHGQITISDAPTLDTPAFTVAGWFQVTQAPASGSVAYLASKSDGNGDGWNLLLYPGLFISFTLQASPTTSVTVTSPSALTLGGWYHLAATFDGSTATFLIDGQPVASASLPGGYLASSAPLILGGAIQPGSGQVGGLFTGLVDGLALSSRALTAGQVRALLGSGTGAALLGSTSGLVHAYLGQSNALDPVGGADGTVVGPVSYASGEVGQAFSFTGQGSYIDLGTSASLSGMGPFAVAAWIKTTSAGEQVIIQQRDVSSFNGEYQLQVLGGKVNFWTFGNGQYGFDLTSNASVNDGRWHLVVAQRLADGSGQVFIDGSLDASSAGVLTPLDPTAHTIVGEDLRNAVDLGSGYASNFVGEMEDIGIYGSTLTPAQVSALESNPNAQFVVLTDQRGLDRKIGGAQDIGADEYQVDLAVTDSAPASVGSNNLVTNTLTVTNNGPDTVSSVTLVDTLPSGTVAWSLSPGAGWATTAVPGKLTEVSSSPLAPGASVTLSLTTQEQVTNQGATLTNSVTLGANPFDVVPGNNSASATSTIPVLMSAGVDIHGQPSNTTVGRPISPAITVAVVDSNGNTLPDDSTQLVTLAIATGPKGATLLGQTTVRAVHGVATFGDLVLTEPGTYTLTATGGALDPDFSNPFFVTAPPTPPMGPINTPPAGPPVVVPPPVAVPPVVVTLPVNLSTLPSFLGFGPVALAPAPIGPLPLVSGYGAGKDAYALTLYRELLDRTPSLEELTVASQALVRPNGQKALLRSIDTSKEYRTDHKHHLKTASPAKSYRDALQAAAKATKPVPKVTKPAPKVTKSTPKGPTSHGKARK